MQPKHSVVLKTVREGARCLRSPRGHLTPDSPALSRFIGQAALRSPSPTCSEAYKTAIQAQDGQEGENRGVGVRESSWGERGGERGATAGQPELLGFLSGSALPWPFDPTP